MHTCIVVTEYEIFLEVGMYVQSPCSDTTPEKKINVLSAGFYVEFIVDSSTYFSAIEEVSPVSHKTRMHLTIKINFNPRYTQCCELTEFDPLHFNTKI